MELHVIPNACSEYSEQQIQTIVWTYRDIITQSDLLNPMRFTFDLFFRMSTRASTQAPRLGFFIFGRAKLIWLCRENENASRASLHFSLLR
jgi:hypothetical protein